MEDNYSKEKWTRIGLQKRAGLVVPLFSVYSKNSLGIGDLKDLRLVIDFCKKSGNSILQLLPMNEVGQIFCPYDSMSSFALEPMYISIEGLLKKESLLVDRIKTVKDSFPLFNKSYVDYRIKPVKLVLLKDIFAEEGRKDLKLVYKFQKANSYWIDDFVLFKALKDYHSGRPWYEWEEPFKLRDRNALNKFIEENSEKINFELWLQWQLHKQFKEAKCYAEDNKVLLKGDLPIFVSRDSADVWAHPEFFKLDFAAGAPPDMYCARGQRWGMPTYNWERIELNNFTYLKEKLKYAQEFYDILRVDHVVGLFRVWSIPYNEPLENQGLNGFFDPIDESMWENHGKKILAVILNNTRMLICAEDLGVIPRSCPKTLEILGIPGNDVQRWVKDWQNRHDFLEPGEYRRLSVAMLSTHDTTNWPAWWENEAGTVDETLFKRLCMQHGIDFEHVCKRLFDSSLSRHGRLRWLNSICSLDVLAGILNRDREHIYDIAQLYLNTHQEKEKLFKLLGFNTPMREKSDNQILLAILKATLASESIFSVQMLIDWLFLTGCFKADPYQYRINIPGTISESNWSLVLPICLEELIKDPVCVKINKMIQAAKRSPAK